jgi:molybdate transport system ATP-binding protein
MSDKGLRIDIAAQIGALDLRIKEVWPARGVTALFGPSGHGKTSILRQIAGFSQPDEGRISFKTEDWVNRATKRFVPPHLRPIGFVHQGGKLLPKTVYKNLSYAEARSPKRSINPLPQSWDKGALIERFELGGLLERTPDQLSGGECQRVALAQAILSQPRLLLLDEPMSALDGNRKAALLSLLGELAAVHDVAMVYVSHDIGEVAQIADRVSIVRDGHIVETGAPVDVLNRHGFQTEGSARTGTVLAGVVSAHDAEMNLMSIAIGPHVLKLALDVNRPTGSVLRLIVHADNVVLSTEVPTGLSVRNALTGVISAIQPAATALADVTMELDGTDGDTLVASVTRSAVTELGLTVGQSIHALIKTAVLAR